MYTALGKTGKEYKELYRKDINAILNKYRFNTPGRMAHFFGQCAIESHYMMLVRETAIGVAAAIKSNHPSAMPELLGYLKSPPALPADVEYLKYLEGKINLGNTDPGDGVKFRGRGFKQLTGRYNYSEYWVYRGWLARDSYDHSWFDKRKATHGSGPKISDPERVGNIPYNTVDTAGFFCVRYMIAQIADTGISVSASRAVTKIINFGASSESIAKRWERTEESNKVVGTP